jgi:hypothetical protein
MRFRKTAVGLASTATAIVWLVHSPTGAVKESYAVRAKVHWTMRRTSGLALPSLNPRLRSRRHTPTGSGVTCNV